MNYKSCRNSNSRFAVFLQIGNSSPKTCNGKVRTLDISESCSLPNPVYCPVFAKSMWGGERRVGESRLFSSSPLDILVQLSHNIIGDVVRTFVFLSPRYLLPLAQTEVDCIIRLRSSCCYLRCERGEDFRRTATAEKAVCCLLRRKERVSIRVQFSHMEKILWATIVYG